MAGLFDLFRTTPEKRIAADLYDRLVDGARQPALYREGGVADTVDGRFDLIALHAFLLFHRMSGQPGWQEIGDRLANHIMKDMDRSLREMGVGDMSVGKKMKKLAQAFYGRLDAYWGALKAEEPGALESVIARNVYRDDALGEAAHAASAARLAGYVRGQIAHLATQPTADILAGQVRFADAVPLLASDREEEAAE
jgi:cytochrome b pre-mRNA-processing protein 3